MEAWGLKNCTQKEEWFSDTVTAVLVPSYIDSAEIVRRAWKRYNLSLGLGLNKIAGKVFRIGHLGNLNEVRLLLSLSLSLSLSISIYPYIYVSISPSIRLPVSLPYLSGTFAGATSGLSERSGDGAEGRGLPSEAWQWSGGGIRVSPQQHSSDSVQNLEGRHLPPHVKKDGPLLHRPIIIFLLYMDLRFFSKYQTYISLSIYLSIYLIYLSIDALFQADFT